MPVIRALYPTQPKMAVVVLLESVWLPLLLAEVGTALWSRAQVEPFLRHRFNALHGDSNSSPSSWALRVDYRPGERCALGYGMPPRLKQSFVDAGNAVGIQWAGLLPAFAWGRQRLKPTRLWHGQSGWLVWPEQDRLLVARIASDSVVALNTGVAFSEDAVQIERAVEVEGIRCGVITATEPVIAATWSPVPISATSTHRFGWALITGHAPALANSWVDSLPASVPP